MSVLEFDERALLTLYTLKKHDELARVMLEAIKGFSKSGFRGLSADDRYAITSFAKIWFTIFTQADFLIKDEQVIDWILLNPTIANLAAFTSFQTTDGWADIVVHQERNLVKLLALMSARNKITFDRQIFFDAEPGAASLWYSVYSHGYHGWLTQEYVSKNLADHWTYEDSRLDFSVSDVSEAYFGSSYVDGGKLCDRNIKQRINQWIQGLPCVRDYHIRNRPNPKKIAVVTQNWWPYQSVYRTLSAYVESLKPDYHVTLVSMGDNPLTDTEMFDDSYHLKVTCDYDKLDIGKLANNDYAAIYYPDVGMNLPSIALANMRLAPVQLMGTGHPISTWGSKIDYFISGDDTEYPGSQENYSERLVLLPGMGAIYNKPLYTPLIKSRPPDDKVVINCSWYGQKINYRCLNALAKIVAQAKAKLLFRFFPGAVIIDQNDWLPCAAEIKRRLKPAEVDVCPPLGFDVYMDRMAQADFALDCFPFGGSNTVSDNIWLGKPVVCLNGENWPGRIGAAILHTVGLDSWVARTEDEYVAIAVNAIDTRDWERAAMSLEPLYADPHAGSFKKAVDFLLANHEAIQADKSRQPIRIGDKDESPIQQSALVGSH